MFDSDRPMVRRRRRRGARWLGALAAIAGLVGSTPARADEVSRSRDEADADPADVHYAVAALEAAGVFGIPAARYWTTREHQSVDWTMDWDWPTWRSKLFSIEKLRFDSNPFGVNAFRHPLVGILDYHVGRSNGFGLFGSALMSYGAGVLWEYLVEYKENPSINDLIMNGAAGIAVGEPLWQVGQLWRGGRMSLADRARGALFSPFDALHDTYRTPPRRRWRGQRAIELGAGLAQRVEADTPSELVGDAELEVARHPALATGAPYDGPVSPGAWSRIHGQVRFGDRGEGPRITGAFFHSRTSLAARLIQDGAGDSTFFALGTAFTYRREQLASEWDQLAVAHLVGLQLQRSRRTAYVALSWDVAAYGDFAMTHALAFGSVTPFPPAPPRITALQTSGYYHALGGSAITRLRAGQGAWAVDLELEGHRMWQINVLERNDSIDVDGMREPITANGVRDWRAFGRLKLAHQPGRWGVAVLAEGAYRHGAWAAQVRELSDLTLGLVAHVGL